MKLTSALAIVKDERFWYRIWGYWRSPGIMKQQDLWSDRKDQQLRSFLMSQRTRGKSRPDSIYEKLVKPKYKVKWTTENQSTVKNS